MAKKKQTRGILAREKEATHGPTKLAFFPGAIREDISFQKTIPVTSCPEDIEDPPGLIVWDSPEVFLAEHSFPFDLPEPGEVDEICRTLTRLPAVASKRQDNQSAGLHR